MEDNIDSTEWSDTDQSEIDEDTSTEQNSDYEVVDSTDMIKIDDQLKNGNQLIDAENGMYVSKYLVGT